ncbi:hydrogenase maturation protease [Mycobacterium sp. NPDC048908]|uniref:hydrogenase maturation protease n=1 Tax=Mycobacterium sp. NPDC048908 TaxID=3364292 RepID=UPI00371B0356
MSDEALVIGVGNEFRRDDGVGLVVAAAVSERKLPGVRVMTAIGEPGSILEAWTGVPVAIAVDAAMGKDGTPGTIRRWTPDADVETVIVSSHALGIPQTYALGQALGQIPNKLVVFTVDVDDVGHGIGLTAAVANAVPMVAEAIVSELTQ